MDLKATKHFQELLKTGYNGVIKKFNYPHSRVALYKAFKKYYKETYPEGEVDEKLPDENDSYYKFTIKTTDGHEVRIEYSTNKYEFQNFKVQEKDS